MRYLIVGLCFALPVLAQNLLPNPGFESWTAGMPDYWNKDDSILVFQEDVVVHGGTFSVKDSVITATQDRADFLSDTFAIADNTDYTFSIWVFDNDLAARVRQAISWHTSGGWSNVYSSQYSGNSGSWQELVLTALSPSGADSACVFIRAYDSTGWDGGAVFYLDDASLTPPATQPPVIVRTWHVPVNPGSGVPVNAYAGVSDDGTIVADTLFYGVDNWNTPVLISHTSVSNDTFLYEIPGQPAGDTVFYCCKFTDDDGLAVYSDTHAYFVGSVGIFINELYYDTPGTDSGCFIEIYAPGGSLSLNGISLVGINGYDGSEYTTIDLSGYGTPADGFFVVADNAAVPNADLVDAGADLQNGPDNLELRFRDVVVDAVGYGTLNGWVFTGEWLPAPDVDFGHALGRYPDGDDTDNNLVDFHDYDTLTPGTSNPIVGIEEVSSAPVPPSLLRNPLRSGIKFGTLISEKQLYPVVVFNALGQHVKTAVTPENPLHLPAGIYFLQFGSGTRVTHKIVVLQ